VRQELQPLLVEVHFLLFHTQVQRVQRVIDLIKESLTLNPFADLGDGIVEQLKKPVGE
jgi:hypothetical protein